MPGIVGLVSRMPREQAELQLQQMVGGLRHESFYNVATWIDESLGVYVGWSEHKNCFSDEMPLWNERGNIALVFSGDVFPSPQTTRDLKERGHQFPAEGPSYLVHLSEEDPTFPAGLNGQFHGLLADRTRGTVTLFNDRYGMHRLYYHESNDASYFAAEAKAILSVRPELRRIDPRGLGELVGCGCVLENRTVFDGVHVLEPASSWIFRNGLIERKGAYFRPQEWEEQSALEPETYYQELREVFARNLPRYFKSHERIGMSLTGGLDTRMIMAWRRSLPGSLPCYSFRGSFRDCQDVVVALQVARACEQPHQVISLGHDFLSRFSHYAQRAVYLSDGCVEVGRAGDLYVNEQARDIAPVRMTGNYGGEVLRAVRAFKPAKPMPRLFPGEFLSHVHTASETYGKVIQTHPLSFTVFRQAPWHHYGLLALEQTQLRVRTPYLDNDFVRTVFRSPESLRANSDLCLRLIADGNPALHRIPTDLGLGGNSEGISGSVSRMFLKFTFKAEYAYDYGMPQWLARIDHTLSSFQPERLFLGRHKLYHYRVWYRDALAGYVRDVLLDSRTLSRSYVERSAVKTIVEGHLKGKRNYTTEIHKLLSLELLHRLFIDSR